jgi:hypothetical protein
VVTLALAVVTASLIKPGPNATVSTALQFVDDVPKFVEVRWWSPS